MDGWREATFNLAGTNLHVAIASGLANARKLIEAIRQKKVYYDFVEIMTCSADPAAGLGHVVAAGFAAVATGFDRSASAAVRGS